MIKRKIKLGRQTIRQVTKTKKIQKDIDRVQRKGQKKFDEEMKRSEKTSSSKRN